MNEYNNLNHQVDKDLTKVFDRTWYTNKNTSKQISDQAKKINERMFESNEPDLDESESQLERLNRNMERLRNSNRDRFGR